MSGSWEPTLAMRQMTASANCPFSEFTVWDDFGKSAQQTERTRAEGSTHARVWAEKSPVPSRRLLSPGRHWPLPAQALAPSAVPLAHSGASPGDGFSSLRWFLGLQWFAVSLLSAGAIYPLLLRTHDWHRPSQLLELSLFTNLRPPHHPNTNTENAPNT